MQRTVGVVPCLLIAMCATSFAGADVLDGFRHPPRENRPETWVQVAGGNASKEGMTLDLEAIADAGFMGIQLFCEQAGQAIAWPGTKRQIECLSSEWEDFIGHTGRECKRLGLRFLMHSCPGWSMAGGPWIPADKTMRELVISRVETSEGCRVSPGIPAKATDFPWRDYKDVAVIAFPTPVGDVLKPLRPVAVKGSATYDHRTVRNYYCDPIVVVPPDDEKTSDANWMRAMTTDEDRKFAFTNENAVASVDVDFGEDVTVRTLEVSSVQRFNHFWSFQPDVTVVVSVRRWWGWSEISRRAMPQATWQDEKPISLALPKTTARHFRVAFEHEHPLVLSSLKFYSGARPDNWEAEGARTLRSLMADGDVPLTDGEAIASDSILDLTARLTHDGTLDWTPPAGDWTVLRIGHVNSGIRNHPAPPEATGWECDKLSTAAADAHYAGYIGRLSGPGGALAGGLLAGFLMDSWECEAQNWTPGLDRTFAARTGRDLARWWPALFGYLVDSRRETSLFYRDWRETLGTLVFENFYGQLARCAHEHGQIITYQTCGGDVFPADSMQHWKDADVPMCEFWRHRTRFGGVGSLDYKAIRPCVSAARIYGKRRVAAETLTCCDLDWRKEFLREWKADLDYYFALGVTHNVFGDFTHTPQVGFLPPGTGYSPIMATVLCRGQTWWREMRGFTDYLARCSYLLESGRAVSDVLMHLGDRVDHKPRHHLPFPKGYSYDYLNRDAFLNRIEVKDGLWTTPEGMTWKALWLYDEKDLRPDTLAKLAASEKAGGKVIRGDVFDGIADLALSPQVREDGGLLWQHRATGAEDIYFFAEENGEPFDGTVAVEGVGEAFLADPVTGEVVPADDVDYDGGYARVRLRLGRSGAKFLVIRKGTPVPRKAEPPAEAVLPVGGPWTLVFAKGWGRDAPVATERLESWSDLPGTPEQKAYSGTVTYRTRFEVMGMDVPRFRRIDLGRVESVARARLNGKDLGAAWTWPYAFDLSGALKPGENVLEVDVTGTWHNRLAYDASQPEKDRKTWTLGFPAPGGTMQETGLFGPVRLE